MPKNIKKTIIYFEWKEFISYSKLKIFLPILELGDKLHFIVLTGAPIVREYLSSTGGYLLADKLGFIKWELIKVEAWLANWEKLLSLDRGSDPAPSISDAIFEFSGFLNLRVGELWDEGS